MVEGMNGHGHPSSSTVTVLYKVANAGKEDAGLFNAFEMPRGAGVTLGSVKNHCMALSHINADGADGYHWRVRVDEKTSSDGSGSTKVLAYSWWDIQDENAKLPVKEASLSELSSIFGSPSRSASSSSSGAAGNATDDMTKAATGAIRSLGKTLNKAVAGTVDHHGSHGHDHGPRVSVIAFKLTEISKMLDKAGGRGGGGGGAGRVVLPKRAAPPAQRQRPQQQAPSGVRRTQQQQAPAAAAPGARGPTAAASAPRVRPPAQKQPSADLMGFDSAGATASRTASGVRPPPKHATSSPASFHNETRAQRLKREYEAKKQTSNRVWDDIDQRWVEVDAKAGSTVHRGSTSAPPGVSNGGAASAGTTPAKKSVGVKLDPNNARGKSATVQAAVNSRVNDMRDSQQKAVKEVRERELKKKQSEAEEDVVRQKLEPQIKIWSEEHGKKKQLRALLSSLHTVLWQGAKWKPVSLGDILDANKCKRCYHRATLVVHPDKTNSLNPEQRFVAKRIFDALTQAKTEFDASN